MWLKAIPRIAFNLRTSLRQALFTQAEFLDNRPVTLDINSLEVVEQSAALAHKAQKCALRTKVLLVALHVLCKVADTVGKERDLALGGTRIGIRLSVLTKDLLFFFR